MRTRKSPLSESPPRQRYCTATRLKLFKIAHRRVTRFRPFHCQGRKGYRGRLLIGIRGLTDLKRPVTFPLLKPVTRNRHSPRSNSQPKGNRGGDLIDGLHNSRQSLFPKKHHPNEGTFFQFTLPSSPRAHPAQWSKPRHAAGLKMVLFNLGHSGSGSRRAYRRLRLPLRPAVPIAVPTPPSPKAVGTISLWTAPKPASFGGSVCIVRTSGDADWARPFRFHLSVKRTPPN
jgi:hypothetical protein